MGKATQILQRKESIAGQKGKRKKKIVSLGRMFVAFFIKYVWVKEKQ